MITPKKISPVKQDKRKKIKKNIPSDISYSKNRLLKWEIK